MRTGISITVSASDRRRLAAIVADRNAAQKHVWRARIILLTADDLVTQAIIAATGKSKTTVWRWQQRFAEAGIAGLLRDKTRPPGKAPPPQQDHRGGPTDAGAATARGDPLDSTGDG
jgi:hypothetical protein